MKEKEKMPQPISEAMKRRMRTLVLAQERFDTDGYKDPDIWFLRGTSVQSLQTAVTTGKIPGQRPGSMFGSSGDVWAAPIVERINSPFLGRYEHPKKKHTSHFSLESAQKMVAGYAAMQAEYDAMFEAVGITRTSQNIFGLMFELVFLWEDSRSMSGSIQTLEQRRVFLPEIQKLIRKMGSKAALAGALEQALLTKPRGVVLGIHKAILDRTRVVGVEDDGVRIGVGRRGLLLKEVSVIEVLGDDGKKYFDEIKKLAR